MYIFQHIKDLQLPAIYNCNFSSGRVVAGTQILIRIKGLLLSQFSEAYSANKFHKKNLQKLK
jgi:hypothetical protein